MAFSRYIRLTGFYFHLFLFIACFVGWAEKDAAAENNIVETQMQHLRPDVLANMFDGEEQMHFSLSWSGGPKIGDLYLSVKKQEQPGEYAIDVRVTDYGLFKLFYPVDDTFTTYVKGDLKLPVRYEVFQKEGRGSKIRRLTRYDQQALQVTYRKNDQPEELFSILGTVYNEFSAFFITRALRLVKDAEIIIPAFVDKKRHQVAVQLLSKEPRKSIFGEVPTLKVKPVMSFKGLYDKDGDTVFWLTDDECRIPVEIESKILIGFLSAELVEYSNTSCSVTSTTEDH